MKGTRLNRLLWVYSVVVVQCKDYTKHLRDDRCGFKDAGGICGWKVVSEKSDLSRADISAELKS